MSSSLTNRQMVLLTVSVLISQAANGLPKAMAKSANTGSWLPLLIGSIFFAVAAFVIVKLNHTYPGKMIFDYSQEIVGKTAGFAISLLFVLYFLITTAFNLASFANTMRNNFLLKTPPWAVILVGIPAFGYAVHKGQRNIARIFEIIGVIVLVSTLAVHVTMLFQGKLNHIRPMFDPAELGKYLAAVKDVIVPFMGVELLLVFPLALPNPKRSAALLFFCVIAVGLIFILIVESSIMMIGMNEIVNYTDPMVVAIRQVEIPAIEFLSRIDILFLTFGFLGIFALIIVQYSAVVEFLSKILPRTNRTIIVPLVGVALFFLSQFATRIDNLREKFAAYWMYVIPVASLLIPILLLAISRVKSKFREKLRDYAQKP